MSPLDNFLHSYLLFLMHKMTYSVRQGMCVNHKVWKQKKTIRLDLRQSQWAYQVMKKAVLALAMITALLVPLPAYAATAKAGAACTKVKATQIVGSKKFTCIKSGNKLVWDKGVNMPKVLVKKEQSINFPAFESVYLANKALTLSKAISTGGLEVSYSATGACSYFLDTNTVKLNAIGTCTLTASQAGNESYLPAPVITRSFEILKVKQEISAVVIADQDLLEYDSYTIEYPSFGSPSPVVMKSNSPDICTINGKQVSYIAIGQCNLTFSKVGDAEYEDAKPINVSFKIYLSAKPGDKKNPAPLGMELSKGGINVKLNAITENISDALCLADSANKGCIDKNGIGVFKSLQNDRYVEIEITIENRSDNKWVPSGVTLNLDPNSAYGNVLVYGIDSLDSLELDPGEGITGSYFILLPNSIDSAKTLICIGDGNDATTFYFKANK